jgi:hypothetical protein
MNNVQKVSKILLYHRHKLLGPNCIVYKILASQKLDIPDYSDLKTFAL